eukprot:scaffold6549_cov71-Phaeocystis_antarctica.AAC.2
MSGAMQFSRWQPGGRHPLLGLLCHAAPSHAVPHAARWRRPRHALRPQHAARSSARLPKHGAVGRRAMHGRKRRAAKQWAEGILPTRCPSRRPREAAD